MGEQVLDDRFHSLGDHIAVNMYGFNPAILEQTAGQKVRWSHPFGVGQRAIPLMTHAGEGSVGLETDDAVASAWLFGDGDELTHDREHTNTHRKRSRSHLPPNTPSPGHFLGFSAMILIEVRFCHTVSIRWAS
jgi:hypothetical protein